MVFLLFLVIIFDISSSVKAHPVYVSPGVDISVVRWYGTPLRSLALLNCSI